MIMTEYLLCDILHKCERLGVVYCGTEALHIRKFVCTAHILLWCKTNFTKCRCDIGGGFLFLSGKLRMGV